MKRPARVVAAATAVIAAVLLTGCTQSSEISNISNKGNNQNFISTTGVSEYKHPTTPVLSFSGPLVGGGTFDSSSYKGKVLVVNFWYAGCPPCRAEAKSLESLSREFAGQDVQFIGVNTRDQDGQAIPYIRNYGVTYPSIRDVATGAVQLAFAANVPPKATPSTVVIDKRGKVGSMIIGGLQNSSTLEALIKTAVAGGD